MAQLRIGTCSWKYPSWAGLVYSAAEGIDYLREYAAQYDTVEIDQWFWSLHGPGRVSLPRERDVASYRAAVPETFRFTVKAPNSITLTHFYRRAKTDPLVANPSFLDADLMRTFLDQLAPLGATLGPVLLQFEYLNRQKMASAAEFQRQLRAFAERLPREQEYAVEVRPILQQGYWMPPIAEVYDRCRAQIGQHRAVVLRLHGPDRQGIEKKSGKHWDRIIAPRDAELGSAVAIAQDLVSQGINVFVNVNNHFEGSAPLTIERFRERAVRPDV